MKMHVGGGIGETNVVIDPLAPDDMRLYPMPGKPGNYLCGPNTYEKLKEALNRPLLSSCSFKVGKVTGG